MSDRPDLKPNKGDAVAALSPGARRLHLAVLTAFAGTGRPPSPADLRQAAQDGGIDPAGTSAALTELSDRDVVAFHHNGYIRAAYPFSPAPTPHRVTWAGGPAVYAMCAIDALGMSAMLDRPVTITATEPGTANVITVEVDRTRAEWNPGTVVVFAGATGPDCCAPSADRTCSHINFFTTAEAAREWAGRRPGVTGVLLDQADALAYGIAEFGAFMTQRGQA